MSADATRSRILKRVAATEPRGIDLETLEVDFSDLDPGLVKGHLVGLGDDGKVWWDEQSPRRVHAA